MLYIDMPAQPKRDPQAKKWASPQWINPSRKRYLQLNFTCHVYGVNGHHIDPLHIDPLRIGKIIMFALGCTASELGLKDGRAQLQIPIGEL
jgi:hypothetical protein